MLDYSWTQAPNDYPTSDGKPVAETDIHRELMFETIDTLKRHFQDDPSVIIGQVGTVSLRRADDKDTPALKPG